jgi:cytochrome c biogenesis protein
LQRLAHKETFDYQHPTQTQEQVLAWFKTQGFKTRVKADGAGQRISAMKGQTHRLGYVLTHAGMIVILLGGLIDSNIVTQWGVWMGTKAPETRNVKLTEIPERSWIGEEAGNFRGSVTIPEGKATDVLFLPYENGYFVQKLPFKVRLDKFYIDYYPTGMPKSFKSDLTIIDGDQQLQKTISVNYPWIYKGIAIYQSSFADGGSTIDGRLWPLVAEKISPSDLKTAIEQKVPLDTPAGQFTLEMDDFRMFNIQQLSQDLTRSADMMKNNGPSVKFKVRDAAGQAYEFDNYMVPVEMEGRRFFLSGVRSSLSEEFKYLYIPVDTNNSIDRFMRFLEKLNSTEKLNQLIRTDTSGLSEDEMRQAQMQEQFTRTLVRLFRNQGFDGIMAFIDQNIKPEAQDQARENYLDILKTALSFVYVTVLEEEGVDVRQDISEFDSKFFDDATFAISGLHRYGAPFYFQMTGFKQIQASGLQMTKSPGKDIVYFGSVMLMVGIFIMFYIRQRRVYVHLEEGKGLLAVEDARKNSQLDKDFPLLVADFKQHLHSQKVIL